MPSLTALLALSPLFQEVSVHLPHQARIEISYKRAIVIGKAYKLTAEDIVNTTAKFWELQADPILMMDGAAATLLTIHLNLCTGTIARQLSAQPALRDTLAKLLNFELIGQFCLTELGHGLDAKNIETTATALSDGSFDLHTPLDRAAKHMPPTSPCGIPTIAVVLARLIVEGEDRGIRPFIVSLHDGHVMSKGITSRILTPRGGSAPVNHCLTYFNHVILPPTSLLGSLEKGNDNREQFYNSIQRIIVGTMTMADLALSSMKMGVYIAGRYSQRRMVTDGFTGSQIPIISFSAQQIPILATIAQAIVFQSFRKKTTALFNDSSRDLTTRHCIAAITKATLVKHCCSALIALSDRCGAQGIFEVNQISVFHNAIRGAAIAEGDILGISVRFGIELLIGRIALPPSTNPDGLLARREASLFQELRDALSSHFKHHRDPDFQDFILPQCQPLVEAIGCRMAFDAAVEDNVDKKVLEMFLASIIREDRAWFSEIGGIFRATQMEMEMRAMKGLLGCLDELLVGLDVESYCTAPITSDESWARYANSLAVFGDTTPQKTKLRALL